MERFKKVVFLFLAFVLCLGLFGGCSNPTNEGEKTEDQKQEDQKTDGEKDQAAGEKFKLIVGFDAGFPPYGYMEGDEYVGFDIDLAREVCKRQGWEFEPRPIEWNSKDLELSSGAINCIWNGFTINGREEQYTWTKPYVDNSQVIMVQKDSGIKKLTDLSGKTVAVQDDSSAYHALTDNKKEELTKLKDSFKELKLVPDYNTAFMDLQAGAVDAVSLDIGVAKYQLENRNGEFVILDEILVKEEYGVGFLLGNMDLRDKVESTLMDMYKDGSFLEIAKKWNLQESVVLGQ